MILRSLEQRGITVRQVRSFSIFVDFFSKTFELIVHSEDFNRPGRVNDSSSIPFKFSSYNELESACRALANTLSNNATIFGESNNES